MSSPVKSCCPQGLNYVDATGMFYNPYVGAMMQVLTWNYGAVTDCYDKCVVTQAAPAAYGPASEPTDCPCCPPGYAYRTTEGACISTVDMKTRLDAIPCIVCDCPEPPDPPLCDTCSPETLPITFSFNNNIKNCEHCNPDLEEPNLTPFASFIADRLIAPIINFIRK